MGNVVMFHIGRSGSTVLVDLLRRHPMVKWDGEMFRWRGAWDRNVDPRDGKAEPMQFLQQRIARVGRGWYGLEFKFFHARRMGMDLAAVLDGFFDAGVTRSIILTRKNYLRKIVSSRVARSTSRWRLTHGQKAMLTPIKLDIENLSLDGETKPLVAFLEDYEQNFRFLDDHLNGRRVLRLTYEEDVECGPQIGCQRICEFLDIPFLRFPVRFVRTTPFKLSKVLINYGEVARTLDNTRFAWMVRDQ